MTHLKNLKDKRFEIANRLFNCLVESYQSETRRFLLSHRDPFENPMGSNFKSATQALIEEIFGNNNDSNLKKHLDTIIRIRAIQDFSPSEAIYFVFQLRDILLEMIHKSENKNDLRGSIEEINLLSDKLILMAMDIYVKCREDVWKVKFDEIMNRPFFGGNTMCLSYLLKKGKIPLNQNYEQVTTNEGVKE